MSIYIAIVIMIITGLLGGWINYLLPANEVDGKKQMQWINCTVIGVGATLLAPLFLQITQSRILDNMHDGWAKTQVHDTASNHPTVIYKYIDTSNHKKDTLPAVTKNSSEGAAGGKGTSTPDNPLQAYFLFIAYCLLASTAGYRFINMLVESVVKGEKLTKLKNENEELAKENTKRAANSQISQQQEHEAVKKQIMEEKTSELKMTAAMHPEALEEIQLPIIPELPPVTHPDDPQKGRFGGKAENNFRKLSAAVTPSASPKFYQVKLWVESTDTAHHPLDSEVIYYVHDSLSPSVFTYKPAEFIDGKAIENDILSYGAFTVGVITDNGKTMLELDLSEDRSFPKQFRER